MLLGFVFGKVRWGVEVRSRLIGSGGIGLLAAVVYLCIFL